jgi:hypothetical protein
VFLTFEAKKQRELRREYELLPSGKLLETIENDLPEEEAEEIVENNVLTAEGCVETAKNVLKLLEELPSEDPTVTDLLLQCPQLKSHLAEFITQVTEQTILGDLLSQYDKLLLLS